MSNKNLHRELCEIGAKWLKRPASTGGHGCHLALIEPACYQENCDVIGYRHGHSDIDSYGDYNNTDYISGYDVGTVLLEAKTSRADFLNDAKKPHRINPENGAGKWRYYICPEGVIQIEDLPPKWGLIWVNKRGHLTVLHGAAFRRGKRGNGFSIQRQFGHFAFVQWQRNTQREISILIMALNRIQDAEELIYAKRKILSLEQKNQDLTLELNEYKDRENLEKAHQSLQQLLSDQEQGKNNE